MLKYFIGYHNHIVACTFDMCR